MNQKDKKYRGFNEIYFVLYLTAVILLLPEGKRIVDEYIISEQNSAYIKSEKSSLNVRLKIEDGNSVIVSADTVNIIYPVGKIDSVKYNFKLVSNNVANLIYNSSKKINSNAFQVIENQDGLARFSWQPQNINTLNRNFEVIVEGEVYSLGKINPNLSTIRFAINTFFIDDVQIASNEELNSKDTNLQSIDNQSNNNLISGSQSEFRNPLLDISIFPENPVTAIAFSRWKSIVRVFGIDLTKDINEIPNIIADDKYDVKIEDIDSKAIYLSGLTSADSEYKVKVELERTQDGRLASSEFIVKPLLIEFPECPKMMYPNISYTFKPNLPSSSNNNFSVKLIHKNNVMLETEEVKSFNFIPQLSDTNKIIKFNRYVDGKLYDSQEGIRIVSPPAPEITKKSYKNGVIYITTKSYGKLQNNQSNVVSKLRFNLDDIKYQDLTGETQYFENHTIQVFRININSNINSIEVSAIDDRGIISNLEKITF